MPPTSLPLVRGGRPRKRWRYVGLFGPDLSLCAAQVAVGPVLQRFWAVWDPGAEALRERTRRGPGRDVTVTPTSVAVRDATGLALDLVLAPAGERIEVRSRHGAQEIRTAKLPVAASGRLTVGGVEREVALAGLLDESDGHHARRTRWWWSAGTGTTQDGRAVAWNLVDGLHDAPEGSERHVWVDGVARHLPPATFAPDLTRVRAGAVDLAFASEAVRARTDRLWPLLRSAYVQPFGTFSGTLGPGLGLTTGQGVMEHHDARW